MRPTIGIALMVVILTIVALPFINSTYHGVSQTFVVQGPSITEDHSDITAVAAGKGSGGASAVLYVYEDSGYTQLKLLDSQNRYPVVIGEVVYVHLHNLNDKDVGFWTNVVVSVGTPDGAFTLGTFGKKTGDTLPGLGHTPVDPYVGDGTDDTTRIKWVVGDDDGDGEVDYWWPESKTITVHYKYDTLAKTFVAAGPLTTTGHLHVIPETAFGVAGSLAAMIGALAIFKARRKL